MTYHISPITPSQILGATVSSLSAASLGTMLGFSGVAIPQFQNETDPQLRMTLDQASWIRKHLLKNLLPKLTSLII